MRARAAAACAAAGLMIGCAGCTSSPAQPQASQVRASVTPTYAPLVLPDRALPSPGCSTVTAMSPQLSGVGTAMVSVPGNPFGVAVTPDGRLEAVNVPSIPG